MRRALVVLGGCAPGAAFLRKMAAESDFLLCADSGLGRRHAPRASGPTPSSATLTRQGRSPSTYMERENLPHIVYPAIKDDTDGMACARYLLERRPEEVVFVGAGGGRIDHWMANFQLLIYLEKTHRARAEQEDMTAWAVHDRLTVRGTPGQLLSVLQMTEELQLSLSGLFYPLDHCDVEFGHPLGVSNVLTEPEAQIVVHKGWALVLHFHPPA